MPKKLFTSLLSPSLKVTEEQLEADVNLRNMERAFFAVDRRNFLGGLAAAGAAAATFGVAGLVPKAEAQTTGAAEVIDIFNFALNFEYLTANLYLAVTGGTPLSSSQTGGSSGVAPTNLPSLLLTGEALSIVSAIAADEVAHITALQATITANGGQWVPQPAIDYSAGAGSVTITTVPQFLTVARVFTATLNSAYAYAAASLFATPSLLTTGAQILGCEGQHLGALSYLFDINNVPAATPVDPADYPPISPNTSFFSITPATIPADFVTPTQQYGSNSALQTGPAIGPARTFQQVLGVVYGSSNATSYTGQYVSSGGYFPKGVNGGITATT